MIAARLGHDHFLVWSLPLEQVTALIPSTIMPVICNGHGWLLFAIAQLDQTRVLGWPLAGRRRVAGWLIPCHAPGGGLGNYFLNAYSDDPLVVLAYRALGMPKARHVRLHIGPDHARAPDVDARFGAPYDEPALAWFADDRCGIISRTGGGGPGGIVRLPLAKRGWHWQPRRMTVQAPFATEMGATAIAAIDCSRDLAIWGAAR